MIADPGVFEPERGFRIMSYRSRSRSVSWLVLVCVFLAGSTATRAEKARPNILFCISDDQSYAHTGANGDPVIRTPAFDRIAREGIRFTRAFCDAPTCGPSRSAILTGQPIWRLEEAGNIHSTLPKKFATYSEMLRDASYFIGHTGKGWSPGNLVVGGRTENPAGPAFNEHRYEKSEQPPGVSRNNYSKNFADFLSKRPKGAPFCFWLGTYEPHRGFRPGLWKNRDPADVVVPPIFPDHEIVREDLLDYFHEIEHFDRHVGEALAILDERGELDNTIVVVTSDHGMPFPRAKASLYDAGSHVPLAIRWPKGIAAPGRSFDGLVNLSDLAPTFLEAARLEPAKMMTARSLLAVFASAEANVEVFSQAFVAMERHDGCRRGGKGYPCRAIRTSDFLFIRNFEPTRWPSGDPDRRNCARDIPFGEVDSSPTKTLLMDDREKPGYGRLYDLAFAKRPAEELYDLSKDAAQMRNVASDPSYAKVREQLSARLTDHLVETKDPRATGGDAPWDFYPYYGLRRNKDWRVDRRPGSPEPSPRSLARPGVPMRGKRVDLQPAVNKFSPGWKVTDCAGDMNPGLRAEFRGRRHVLLTHPLNRRVGCKLTRSVKLPAKRPKLRLVVGHYPGGDWLLIVRANGEELLKKHVGGSTAKKGWLALDVDLSAFAGKTTRLELVNQPTGWQNEGAFWETIKIAGD